MADFVVFRLFAVVSAVQLFVWLDCVFSGVFLSVFLFLFFFSAGVFFVPVSFAKLLLVFFSFAKLLVELVCAGS